LLKNITRHFRKISDSFSKISQSFLTEKRLVSDGKLHETPKKIKNQRIFFGAYLEFNTENSKILTLFFREKNAIF